MVLSRIEAFRQRAAQMHTQAVQRGLADEQHYEGDDVALLDVDLAATGEAAAAAAEPVPVDAFVAATERTVSRDEKFAAEQEELKDESQRKQVVSNATIAAAKDDRLAMRMAAEKAEVERMASDRAIVEKAAAELERILAEKAATEAARVAAEKTAVENAIADKLAAEKAIADRIAAEKAITDRIAAEKAITDKIAAEKAIADKIAAEKAIADDVVEKKETVDKVTVDDIENHSTPLRSGSGETRVNPLFKRSPNVRDDALRQEARRKIEERLQRRRSASTVCSYYLYALFIFLAFKRAD